MSFRLLPALFRAVFRLNIGGRLPPNPTLPAFFITLLGAGATNG